MSYCPFVTDKKNKPITVGDGGKAIVRRFAEGDYRRFQAGLTKITKAKQKNEDLAAWELMRDLTVQIGVVSWNFVDENGDPLPTKGFDIDKFDGDVFSFLRDEIVKHNPCLWKHVGEPERERLGIAEDAKNS